MIENLDFTYKGDMTGRFICFNAGGGVADFRENMLVHNSIGGHLSLSIEEEADKRKYCYNISGKKSLRELVNEKKATASFVRDMLKSFERCMLEGKPYMLEESGYLLHPDTIFFNETDMIYLCYLPGECKDIHDQLSDLMTYILDNVEMTDSRSVYLLYLVSSAAKDANVTFGSLYNMLDRGLSEKNQIVNLDEVKRPGDGPENILALENKKSQEQAETQPKEPRSKNIKAETIWKIALFATFVGVVIYFIL